MARMSLPSMNSRLVSDMFHLAVYFIADDTGAFTGALGLLFDANELLGAPCSKVRLIIKFLVLLHSCFVH